MSTVATLKPKAKVHFMSQPEARKFEVNCSSCNLREVCLPGGLCAEDLEQVQNIVQCTAVQEAWERGQALEVTGWIYDLKDGLLTDLQVSRSS